MANLQLIVGSTREGRAADLVLPWLAARIESHEAFDLEVLDLRDWPLPMFQEHQGTIGDRNDPTYSEPIVREWNKKVAEADAYVVLTPEYNHSITGVLKNALDNVFITHAMRNKPITTVSYSGGIAAGIRAIEHLALIAIELEAVPLRTTVPIPTVGAAFVDGEPKDPMLDIALRIALDDLAWYANLLAKGRAEGELEPSKFRTLRERMRLAQG